MYIRRVSTRSNSTGESYFTHRLVRTELVADRVRQVTLLNLGRHFAVAQEDWPSLCPRIEENLTWIKAQGYWVFRPIVTGRFGNVTGHFGNVTGDSGRT